MGMFFGIVNGNLMLEFEGSIDGLRKKFQSDKESMRASISSQIESQNHKKEGLVIPEDFDARTPTEQVAINADIAARIAHCDNQIAKFNQQITMLDNMKFEDQKFFDLESLVVK